MTFPAGVAQSPARLLTGLPDLSPPSISPTLEGATAGRDAPRRFTADLTEARSIGGYRCAKRQ